MSRDNEEELARCKLRIRLLNLIETDTFDVELVVDYRDHRHSPRRDEWWQDPRQR
jgi:hypothetical protein